MNLTQKLYNWFNSLKTPPWLRAVLGEFQGILVQVLWNISKEFLSNLEAKVIEVNGQYPTNEAKFDAVFKWVVSQGMGLKDSAINLLIELVVSKLKNLRAI